MVRYAMVIDSEKCLNCKACLVACTAENKVPLGQHRNNLTETLIGTYPEISMKIEPGQCHHCDNAPCVRVCPTGASFINEHGGGFVMIDKEKCIGCRYCMLACPYDARSYNEETGVVDKCTFCFHRLAEGVEPACVETCPTKVRVFGDINESTSDAAKLMRQHSTEQKKLEAGTGPNLYYIID